MMNQDISMSVLGDDTVNKNSSNFNNNNNNNNNRISYENSGDFSDINASENGSGGSSSGGSSSSGVSSSTGIDIPPIPHKKQPRVFKKQKTVDMNPMPVPGTKETQFHTGSLKEPSHIHGMPERSRGASFPGTEMNSKRPGVNDYLTPTDPPNYLVPGIPLEPPPDIPPSSPSPDDTNSWSFKNRRQPFQRFDSGLGDCESERGSNGVRFSTSSSMNSSIPATSNPRLSTQYEEHYEDIDQYNKSNRHDQHRDSTDKMRFNHSSSAPNSLRPLPEVNIRGVTQSDSEDADPIMNTSIAETVSGDIQDPRHSGTLPHTYTPLNIGAKQFEFRPKSKAHSSQGGYCCIVFFIIFCLLISLAALGLSIYLLISKSDSGTNTKTIVMHDGNTTIVVPSELSSETQKELSDMRMEITRLTEENRLLKENVKNLTSQIENIQPGSTQSSFRQELQIVENRLSAEIANISLTPGPPGVANFSLCVNESIAMSAPFSNNGNPTLTSYMPSEEEVKRYFVIFAYCTYEGATDAFLETTGLAPFTRFRCSCNGTVSGSPNTRCIINIWKCPRLQ